ncbi:hypothetical protein GN330_16360 [Nitratireductor sp. CAU 1489]|uniref:Lipoprotein n=1 Tax=Nitratireductor arenosus TaxID=2682096 RepID=A0A844QLR0_9HYPH|nr:hypothetical protein [Nitratireductor arenosus]MVA98821.1 hypothetical protein [Nitratireductor arenosus]
MIIRPETGREAAMFWRWVLVALAGGVAGCSSLSSGLDDEIVSSLQFDQIPCERLVAERDALAAEHGDPATLDPGEKPGARPALVPTGFGTLVPDARSRDTKEHRKALGRIEAMDRSITRRECRSV